MAKYRHRIFEMYEFRAEAIRALTSRPDRPDAEAITPESWNFELLHVSRLANVVHVEFKSSRVFGAEVEPELRKDFARLTESLVIDSKVLIDFSCVKSFSASLIDVLTQFGKELRIKGSRMALCCLEPAVHRSFFGKND